MREAAKPPQPAPAHAVHRPGEGFVPGRAELEARHEDDVRQFRQRLDLRTIEQVGRDALDAVCGQALAQALLAEARNADDALARRRALGQPRQRRSDLAADAENDDVASSFASSATSSGAGVVITSSRCSASRKRSGRAASAFRSRDLATRERASITGR